MGSVEERGRDELPRGRVPLPRIQFDEDNRREQRTEQQQTKGSSLDLSAPPSLHTNKNDAFKRAVVSLWTLLEPTITGTVEKATVVGLWTRLCRMLIPGIKWQQAEVVGEREWFRDTLNDTHITFLYVCLTSVHMFERISQKCCVYHCAAIF
eukprot:gb/GECG01002001.1/.p1 GENE.gb/GECG01002001.1/~~gb/GECG01002001.1/.p1  ORF type:complete len:152 (+),score=13.63 gb/GECG01002001.1/:1-456(+)